MDSRTLGLAALGGIALYLFASSRAQAATMPAPGYGIAPGEPYPAPAAGFDWSSVLDFAGGVLDTFTPEPAPDWTGIVYTPSLPDFGAPMPAPAPVDSGAWAPPLDFGEPSPVPIAWNGTLSEPPSPVPVAWGDEWGGTFSEPPAPVDATASGARLSQTGLDYIKAQEGFRSVPYWDVKGYSIGYGHFMGPTITIPFITQAEGETMLLQDVAACESSVQSLVRVPLTQGQYDALIDFCYNLGAGALAKSTLLAKLNAGDYAGAANEFGKWILADGAPNSVLVARRAGEVEMFTA